MTCHYPQDGISALVLQSSFREENVLVASQNVGFFLRLKNVSSMKTAYVSHYSEVPIVSRFHPRDG